MKQSSKTYNVMIICLYFIEKIESLTINTMKSMRLLKMNIIYEVENTSCTIITCILNNQTCVDQNVYQLHRFS